MISRGVETSIPGGVVAMVGDLSLGRYFSFFFLFVIVGYLFLSTKSVMQQEL